MASFGIAARIACILRWQPENQRQAWLFAVVSGLAGGCAYGLLSGLYEGPIRGLIYGLVFAGVYAVLTNVRYQRRLRRRQKARGAVARSLTFDSGWRPNFPDDWP
jgi:hypothetical protein